MTPSLQHVAVVIFAAAALAQGRQGKSSCSCIENIYTYPGLEAISTYVSGNNLVYTPPGSSQSYTFPSSYGNEGCKAHDLGLAPYCSGTSKPGWCAVKWCYVPSTCSGVAKIQTRFFSAVENLYFSYGTCAGSDESSNSYDKWSDDVVVATKKMVGIVEGYARSARFQIEETYSNYNTSAVCSVGGTDMCPCAGCSFMSDWNSEVCFTQVGMLAGPSGTQAEQRAAKCLSDGIATTYQRTAAIEADPDFARVGYQYFADQLTGSYTQWPKQDWTGTCNVEVGEKSFDPRFRPWYATAATGPKDVIIVVDVSGSMHEADRHELARNAVKTILDTLTWKDFATIILFNSVIAAVYSQTLVPVTEQNRAAMQGWCDNQEWKRGGTNFKLPMEKVFQVIEQSVSAGTSSMCQKAVMFLTDGDADFGTADYALVKAKSDEYDAIIFSYALGDGANRDVPKRLACENNGVFYAVEDGADLSQIMSAYYEYFSHGQEMCSGSWIKYTAISGGHTLYAGCMAMYDRTVPTPELLGVSCMDLNLFADVSEMKKGAGWNYFKCVASDMTKMCRRVDLTECHIQKIRLAYSQESVCTYDFNDYQDVTADKTCPCTDKSCQDTPGWTDEKGYFCDTWVGDDCNNPDPSFGYSSAGMTQVRANCKRSCGLCDWGTCTATSSVECPVAPIANECRACIGRVSGVDIDGDPMACPSDAPRDLFSRTTTPCPTVESGRCLVLSVASQSPPTRLSAAVAAAVVGSLLGSASA